MNGNDILGKQVCFLLAHFHAKESYKLIKGKIARRTNENDKIEAGQICYFIYCRKVQTNLWYNSYGTKRTGNTADLDRVIFLEELTRVLFRLLRNIGVLQGGLRYVQKLSQ